MQFVLDSVTADVPETVSNGHDVSKIDLEQPIISDVNGSTPEPGSPNLYGL